MSAPASLGARVVLHGLVSRADLNGQVGIVVRPPQEDGRLGIAIGLSSVAVRLANLRLAPGAMPTPIRTKYTLDYRWYQIESARNLGLFLMCR